MVGACLFFGVVSIRHGAGCCSALGFPLLSAGGALGEFPFKAEQVFEVIVVPLHRVGGPCALQAAADGIHAFAAAKAVFPAQALLFDGGALGFATDILVRIGSAMRFAEGVSAGDEGNCLLVIHRHARERLPNIRRRGDWIRLAIGSFRIHIDQAHLNGAERIFELTVAVVAFVCQPLALRSPVNVFFRLPDVLAPAAETEGLQSHRIQRHVAGENDQVGPGEFPAVLLLDRPDQPARLVEAHVVRPAVEGSKSLRSGARAAAAIGDAVRACAMPRHADEERPIVAVVRRPPLLRVRHQGMEILDHGIQVEALELLGVIERLAHGIGQGRVLVQDLQVQLIGPPVCVCWGSSLLCVCERRPRTGTWLRLPSFCSCSVGKGGGAMGVLSIFLPSFTN